MLYTSLLSKFSQLHKNQLNILIHIFTTTLGIYGLINIIKYPLTISFIYSIFILLNTSYCTGTLNTFYLLLINFITNIYPITKYTSYICITASFILQDFSHLLTNEQTFVKSYYIKLDLNFIKDYFLHTIFLIPLMIDTALNSRFDNILLNYNNLCSTNLESELIDDINNIDIWVRNKNPSKQNTSHWWYQKLTEIKIKNSFKNICKSKNIYNSLHSVFKSNVYNIERIDSMNEVYVSSLNDKVSSDKVFFSNHIDGPMGFFPGVRIYRSIIGISENEYIRTKFPFHNQDYCISKGDFISFDYNRDIHFIYKQEEASKLEYRIVLKAHYLIYPKVLKWYARIVSKVCSFYNSQARRLFVFTLSPQDITTNMFTRIILYSTNKYYLLEQYFGLDNLSYIFSVLIISYFFNNWLIFLYSTSFIHYFLYIGTYYYRDLVIRDEIQESNTFNQDSNKNNGNILFQHFKRDCLFYKTIGLTNLLVIYSNSIIESIYSPLLIGIIGGFLISFIASLKLGLDQTYFGSELGICPPIRINSFPYNVFPHPMILGQIFSLLILYTYSIPSEFKFLVPIHIGLYFCNLIQEQFDFNYKSIYIPSIYNIVKKSYIYPIIWEDSETDQIIMDINENDTILMITSGGDNALDALIHNPTKIYCVDMNKYQNYLLLLKIASIKVLERIDFIKTFGCIDSTSFFENKDLILENIDSNEAREWWRDNLHNIKSFNRSGSCGIFIKILDFLSKNIFRYDLLADIKQNSNKEYQYKLLSKFKLYKISLVVYFGYIFFGSFAGVPLRQLKLMEISTSLIDNIITYLLEKTIIMSNNPYYRFYACGLSEECCFNYMKEDNYEIVKKNLDRIEIYTDDLVHFIKSNQETKSITKAILLDHQDWIEQVDLVKEWKCFFNNLNESCHFFWRSASPTQSSGLLENVDYKLKCTINLEEPNQYTDRIGMYRSVFYGTIKKDTLIPDRISEQKPLCFVKKIKTLYKMISYSLVSKNKSDSHEDFLNKFYQDQASDYDDYRREMLHGKKHLIYSLPYRKGMKILLMAGGTGDILDYISSIIQDLEKITIVDLSDPLLKVAKERITKNGWTDKVELIKQDVTSFDQGIKYDLVIITYSLSMILNWKNTIINIKNLLEPNGYLAISDFTIIPNQGSLSKFFWKNMFSFDKVHLNYDHCNLTDKLFKKIFREYKYGGFPLIPFLKCPYYFSLHQKINN